MLWLQNDHPQLVRNQLRHVFGNKLSIRTTLPDKWRYDKSPPQVLVVGDTSTGGDGWDTELVRITVHARDSVTARRIMTAIDSAMTTPMVIGWFFGVKPATKMISHPDSKTGGWVFSSSYRITTSRKSV